MNRGLQLLGSPSLGAGLMYMFDPAWGRRRRALVRDKTVSLLRQTGNAIGPTTRDLSNRTRGLAEGWEEGWRSRGRASPGRSLCFCKEGRTNSCTQSEGVTHAVKEPDRCASDPHMNRCTSTHGTVLLTLESLTK